MINLNQPRVKKLRKISSPRNSPRKSKKLSRSLPKTSKCSLQVLLLTVRRNKKQQPLPSSNPKQPEQKMWVLPIRTLMDNSNQQLRAETPKLRQTKPQRKLNLNLRYTLAFLP